MLEELVIFCAAPRSETVRAMQRVRPTPWAESAAWHRICREAQKVQHILTSLAPVRPIGPVRRTPVHRNWLGAQKLRQVQRCSAPCGR